MRDRESILERIHEALMVQAPVPGIGKDGAQPAGSAPPQPVSEEAAAEKISNWLPVVGEAFEDQVHLFAANSADLKTEFYLLGSQVEMLERLMTIAKEENWKKIGSHHGFLTDAAVAVLCLPVCETTAYYDVNDLESCDAGISECEALIAQTGSVLVSSRTSGGRALSALPPHHVVLATRDQMLPDLPSAITFLKNKYTTGFPSFISFITGPSRTGDIERILVLGAHGPKKLTILCY